MDLESIKHFKRTFKVDRKTAQRQSRTVFTLESYQRHVIALAIEKGRRDERWKT